MEHHDKNNNLLPLLLLLTSVGLSLFGFQATYYLTKQQNLKAIHAETELTLVELENNLNNQISAVTLLASLFELNDSVSPDDFKHFSKGLLAHKPGIQALEWIPFVKHEDRANFERDAKNTYPNFRITEKDPATSKLKTAVQRIVYYPVFYIEPHTGNEKALGFDLGSEPIRQAALKKSMGLKTTVISQRVSLVQDTMKEYGFLVFNPIADKYTGDISSFTLGVFRIASIVDAMTNMPPDTQLYLYDMPSNNELEILYPTAFKGEPKIDDEYCSVHIFDIADRRWQAIACRTPSNDVGQLPAYIVLFMGLALTVLLLLNINTTLNRQRIINREITEQTRKITDAQRIAENSHRKTLDTLSKINHEIRTPVNSITGCVDLLENSSPDSTQLKTINIIKYSLDQIIDLINNTLETKRISTTNLVLDKAPVDIDYLCEETLELLRPEILLR